MFKCDIVTLWWHKSSIELENEGGSVLIELRTQNRPIHNLPFFDHSRYPASGWGGLPKSKGLSNVWGGAAIFHGNWGDSAFSYKNAGVVVPLWLPLVILISLAMPPRLRRWRADRGAGFDVTIKKQKDEAAN